VLETIFVALQTFHVLFLALHDWIPLGRLNDVAAVRSEISPRNLFMATIIQTSFFAVGLFFSVSYFGQTYPTWLNYWLWISISSGLTQSGQRVTKKCSAIPTHSCPVVMTLCQTQLTFFFIWRLPRHYWS
jgi:hypothetical protein